MSSHDNINPGEEANKAKLAQMQSGKRLKLDGGDATWEVVANDGESVIARNEMTLTNLGMWEVIRSNETKSIHSASELQEGDTVYHKMDDGNPYTVDKVEGD